MRSVRPSPEHQEAISRRLALLGAELQAVRDGDGAASESHTRIRADRLAADAPEPRVPPTVVREERPGSGPDRRPPLVAAVEVPVLGRHADRRLSGRLIGDLVPPALRGRVALGPGQVALVSVVVALALAFTCWWLVRRSPQEVVAPDASRPVLAGAPLAGAAAPTGPPGSSGSPGPGVGAGSSTAAAELVVDVAGKVRRPGIAVLEPGSRVVDALEAAGGARPGVDLSSLNLARPLVDGEQILVGATPVPGVAAGVLSGAPTAAAGGALVNLNTAGQAELESLPEVGPVTATAILAWRDEHGGFSAVDELLEVDGIGEATLGQLAALVTI